ncbi:GDSL-type esterase/lipase family protein [Halodesulfovibrio sp.]|uniref:GDSL-type esterase/lipase family protein n=1 Tax=Halodesulfovibrio sp. TaxID=1912772 RepID=UPI0025B97F29|nr:GDSL-type esterase/lipase family protein [Halodesulfovibrio sp.]
MKTFFFFGDSLTLGVNDKGMLGWTGRFASTLDVPVPPTTFYNLGVCKHSSHAVIERWKDEVDRRALPESDVRIMFSFGVVDMAAPEGKPIIPLQQSVKNLEALIQEATSTYPIDSIRVLSPFPVAQAEHRGRIEELHFAYAAVCRKYGVGYVDVFTSLAGDENYMGDLQDGVHPAEKGCEVIAGYLSNDPSIPDWIA